MRQILDAVHFLHTNDIVHLDLKVCLVIVLANISIFLIILAWSVGTNLVKCCHLKLVGDILLLPQ